MRKVRSAAILTAALLLLPSCAAGTGQDAGTGTQTEAAASAPTETQPEQTDTTEETTAMTTYAQITQEEAKRLMDTRTDLVILDVREQDEYDAGHIPGAVLMPYTRAAELAPSMLPDKGQTILVYCRSGRRSKIAAQTLADLGYTDVREFGGIIDWPFEVTK